MNFNNNTTTVSTTTVSTTTVAVHGGIFHADDVLCVALVHLLHGEDVKVERLSRDYEGNHSEFTYILDVGGKFDGDRFYDHHQKDVPTFTDGTRHCGASLFWSVKGEQICSTFTSDKEVEKEMATRFGELLKGIAARDNGQLQEEEVVYSISSAIKDFNNPKPFGPAQDEAFAEAVAFAEAWLKSWFRSQAARLPGMLEMKKVINDNLTDSPVLALPKGGAWQEALLNNPQADHIKCVCYPAFEQGQWSVQAVPVALGSQESRLLAPKELRGAPAGTLVGGQKLVFCHPSGFLMKVEAANAAEAIKAAETWLE